MSMHIWNENSFLLGRELGGPPDLAHKTRRVSIYHVVWVEVVGFTGGSAPYDTVP